MPARARGAARRRRGWGPRSRSGGAAEACRAAAARRGETAGSLSLHTPGDEDDTIGLVDLDELHLDAFVPRCRQVLAHVVGPDGKLAVSAVDEDGELDAGR